MFIRDIKIKGGVHNGTWHKHYVELTEEQLNQLHEEIHLAIAKVVKRESAWVEVTYTKAIGSKINS